MNGDWTIAGETGGRWREIDERYGYATMFVLLGIAQVLVSFSYASGVEFIIIGAGGWLLIGLGESLVAGRMTFRSWISNDRIERVAIVVGVVFALILVAYSIRILMSA